MVDSRFTAIDGADGTGDIYPPSNIEFAAKAIKRTIDFALADGGFAISPDSKTGERRDNLQEIITGRLLLSQVVLAIETLKEGGSVVVKLFDVFSNLTASILFCLCQMFNEVYIVKPIHSFPLVIY